MKKIIGTVTSAKTPQTAIVAVNRRWQHPVYLKFVKKTSKFACHYENMEVNAGDKVAIVGCRPMSKTKKFKIVEKIVEEQK